MIQFQRAKMMAWFWKLKVTPDSPWDDMPVFSGSSPKTRDLTVGVVTLVWIWSFRWVDTRVPKCRSSYIGYYSHPFKKQLCDWVDDISDDILKVQQTCLCGWFRFAPPNARQGYCPICNSPERVDGWKRLAGAWETTNIVRSINFTM